MLKDDDYGFANSTTVDTEWIYHRISHDCNYAMGIDPVWGISSNELNLSNNIKMKLSVIFGVLHMSFGIFHKG